MPDLNPADVAAWDLTKVDAEIKERHDEVARITDGADDWSMIPQDREGAERLPKMMQEVNLLAKRRDEIKELTKGQDQFKSLQKVLLEPEKYLQPKGPAPVKDFAHSFLDHDITRKLKAGDRGVSAEFPTALIGMKATLGQDATQTNIDTDYPMRSDRLGGTVDERFQNPNIADLIPSISTSTTSIEYVTEDYTDAAAEVNEGDAKAESSLDFNLVTENVRQIGVGIKASAQVLGDVGLMTGLVQARIRQDVARREDLQLLLGNGVAPNLQGIIPRLGAGQNTNTSLTDALGKEQAFLEALYKAQTQSRQAFSNPNTVVMNSLSWQSIRLSKDANDQYFFGPPWSAGEDRVWGMRVVLNENMADDTTATNIPALVGDFADGAIIARNPNVAVGVTDSDASDFLADILTFKVSIREALIVQRVDAFQKVTVIA